MFNKIDLATNIVLINFCMSIDACSNCSFHFNKKYCIIYRYTSRTSMFHNNNKIICRSKEFCLSQDGCRKCIYSQDRIWFESAGGSCSTNILSMIYSKLKGNVVL